MEKNKRRKIVISIILLLGIIISFLVYISGNRYRMTAWNELNKESKEFYAVPYFSTVKIIKLKHHCVLPYDRSNLLSNDVEFNEGLGGYIEKDEISIHFKENVPEIAAKIKIALMDGIVIEKSEFDKEDYLIKVNGISDNKLNKLVDKLKHDPMVDAAGQNVMFYAQYHLPESETEDIQDVKTAIVTFYRFENFKLCRCCVIIATDTGKTFY